MGISPLSQIEGDYLASITLLGAALAGLQDLTRRLNSGSTKCEIEWNSNFEASYLTD